MSSPTDSRETGPHASAIATPSGPNLNSPEGTWDARVPPEQQPLVYENLDTEMVARRRLASSSPRAILPPPQPVVPVPVGLSDKEIARLRAQTLGSQQSQTRSTSSVSQPETTSSANAATESGEAPSPYDTRRLHSEVESLRREIERLRADRLVDEAPPTYYSEGNG